MKKLPKQILAPVIITGITVGFLVSAYRFVTGKVKEPGLDDTTYNKTEPANTPSTLDEPESTLKH